MASTLSNAMLSKIGNQLLREIRVMMAHEGGNVMEIDRLVRMVYVHSLIKMYEILKGPADNKKIARQLTAMLVQHLTQRNLSEAEIYSFIGADDFIMANRKAETKPTPFGSDARKSPMPTRRNARTYR
ncbi:MAG: hypothetical protein QM537_03425 [Candidatus Symbiobacter sp.]|nr:hypothetical protein [Candidatus Symbiobacter sp.]